MKVLLFANTDWYLFNFRLSLINALRAQGHEIILVSPDGPYGARLESLGFRWTPAPMDRRSLNPIGEARLVLWLARLLRREKVDLIHNFTIKCAVYGSIAARLGRVPACVNAVAGLGYVFTNEDNKAKFLRPFLKQLMRMALNGAQSRLVLQNPDDMSLFEKAGIVAKRRIRLIAGSGVNCEKFKPFASRLVADNPNHENRALRVLLPARLLWDKGIKEFVTASSIVRQQGGDMEFWLAGDPDPGNPASIPDPILKSWVSEQAVKLLGHVEDMPALFNSVDVVVLPSYREGLPKGLIEAAACGIALVATDVPGCRQVVTHEINGLLVPPKNGQAIADALFRLRDDLELRERLGRAARLNAIQSFSEVIVVEQTLAVYRELVQGIEV